MLTQEEKNLQNLLYEKLKVLEKEMEEIRIELSNMAPIKLVNRYNTIFNEYLMLSRDYFRLAKKEEE